MNRKTVHGWFKDSSLVRRATEALWAAVSRRHLARLDRLAPARCQKRILLGLIHQARASRFGRDHDFRRIRTLADFRRLAPLRSRADLWRLYGQKEISGEDYSLSLALGIARRESQAAHRRALGTALALVAGSRPRSRLLSGTLLFVNEEGPSSITDGGGRMERLPLLVRPYAQMATEVQAEECARLPVTCLVGSAERLLPLIDRVKQLRGKSCLTDVWPGLSAILYTRRFASPVEEQLRATAEGVLHLEMIGRAEGPIAVDDPRFGQPRLLFDHGVYFEFVPPDRAGESRCPRYGIEEVELGVPYELALTSPAGLWACRIGRTVCLEERHPPLVRFLDPPVPQSTGITEKRRARRTDLIMPAPAPESHPQSDGMAAAPPESFVHSPWSILADRG